MWSTFLAQSEPADVFGTELENVLEQAPTTASEAVQVIGEKVESLWTGLLLSLPIILIGLLVLLLGVVVATALSTAVGRGLHRTSADPVVIRLLTRVTRALMVAGAMLFALSVMGVSVANVVTFLAVLGFAVGLAIQGILENFVAGIILLMRKPFRAGDQIITNEFEGTVEDIDFRITRLIAYDGTVTLIPNAQVYSAPLVNLTNQGRRRTTLVVGIDYRDDHDAARAVLANALVEVEGVLEDPPSEVLLTELADSSVNFELRYWTRPDIRSVRHTQDRVLSAAKRAVEDAGMTIPWPIRTLVVDGPVSTTAAPPQG